MTLDTLMSDVLALRTSGVATPALLRREYHLSSKFSKKTYCTLGGPRLTTASGLPM